MTTKTIALCQTTIGRTVAAELRRRKDCREGLKDTKVRVVGRPGEVFVADGSEWGPDGKLFLDLRPEGMPEDACYPESARSRFRETGLLTLTSAELMQLVEPEGYLRRVPASRVVLLSEWPIVCPCWLPTEG